MQIDAFEQIVRPAQNTALAFAGRIQRWWRVGNEIRGRLHHDWLDILVNGERKMQRARNSFDVTLVEGGEVLGDQPQPLRYRRGEAHREA
jgi:hypothetical protein